MVNIKCISRSYLNTGVEIIAKIRQSEVEVKVIYGSDKKQPMVSLLIEQDLENHF